MLGLAVVWIGIRAVEAKQHLTETDNSLAALRSDLLTNSDASRPDVLAAIQSQARAARNDTDDPIWRAASHIPLLGRPLRTTSGVAQAASALSTSALPQLLGAVQALGAGQLTLSGGTVNLPALSAEAQPLDAASQSIDQQLARLQRVPASGFVPPLSHARASALTTLRSLSVSVHAAATTAAVAPQLLGGDGPRHYFVAFQNNAEARASGGIVGAYGILDAVNGHLSFAQLGSDADLQQGLPPVTGLSVDYLRRFQSAGAATIWQDANLGGSFPTSAQTWMQLWQEQTGQHLDGAIATDPVALSYLLAATGPVTDSLGTVVTAQNVVALSESTVYAQYGNSLSDQLKRKDYLQSVSKAASDAALHAPDSEARGVVAALARAEDEGRLLLYTSDATAEKAIGSYRLSGELPSTTTPTAVLTVDDSIGSKLDYYLSTSLDVSGGRCTAGDREVTATITLTNDAPTSGLPSFVLGDAYLADGPPGTSKALVSYYATAGAQVVEATIDGVSAGVNAAEESGHPVFSATVDLPPSATTTITLQLREPTLPGAYATRPQPLVRSSVVDVRAKTCS